MVVRGRGIKSQLANDVGRAVASNLAKNKFSEISPEIRSQQTGRLKPTVPGVGPY